MSLSEAAEIATLLAIVTGFAFGIAQMRLANRQRHDQVAAEVYGLSLTTDHIGALHVVFALPDNADPALVLQSTDVLKAAHLLENHCEYWGILVFQRLTDLHTLDRKIGGVVNPN